MIKIEKNKEYEFRLMPNFYNLNQRFLELEISNADLDKTPTISKKFFCYVLSNNKIECLMFGLKIQNYIHKCITGFFGTPEGYFISVDEVDQYYANSDKSIIEISEEEDFLEEKESNKEKLILHKDVVYFERINLFDIQDKHILVFKVRDNHGFMEIYNLGLKEVDPLYKKGDDQKRIESLYDGVQKLEDVVEEYKQHLIKDHKETKWIFGKEALDFNNKYRRIKFAMEKLIEAKSAIDILDKFAQEKFQEKYPLNPNKPVWYEKYEVKDEKTLRIHFGYGGGDLEMNDYFDVKI